MAQFDVYLQPFINARKQAPFVVALQSNRVVQASDVVIAPLMRRFLFIPPGKLTPVFEIEDEEFVLILTQIVGVRANILGKPVTNLAVHRDSFISALDLLVTGI